MPHPPPYTYNDSRLTYGEHCFLWNGGYDEVCLVIGFDRKRKVGVSSGGGKASRREPLPNLPWIDITVCAQLLSANEEEILGMEKITQGARGELAPGTIELLASRTNSEETTIKYVAETLGTNLDQVVTLEEAIEVVADPILATQSGKTIPLANLRSSKPSSIIFRTEVTSSNKSPEDKTPPTTKTIETVEMAGDFTISAAIITSSKKSD